MIKLAPKGYYIQPPSDCNLVRVQTSKSVNAMLLSNRKVSPLANFVEIKIKFYDYRLWPEFDP